MENNTKKVNLMLVIVIVVLLIAVGVCGTILITKGTENKTENTANEISNTTQSAKQEGTTVATADERFKTYSANMIKQISNYNKSEKAPDGNSYSPVISMQIRGDYLKQAKVEQISISPEGDLTILQNGTSKKAKSNVISCFELEQGNGGYTYIMCINSDGTVSSIDTQGLIDSGKISIKNYTNVKNIVNLISIDFATGVEVYGVNIDGNICALNN